ncbi:MAG: hypothetical protein RL133_1754 [Pseudomonadota bacterium]
MKIKLPWVRHLLGIALLGLSGALAAAAPSQNLQWRETTSAEALDQAFSEAARTQRPLLLYWGATWCPPCNQLKKTVFQTEAFAQLSKGFVAAYIDGDQRGAQALGQRFKVRGYPTVVVFSAKGEELFRLPSGGTPEQTLQALASGLGDGRSIRETVSDALAGRPVSPAGWRMLALYNWGQDGTSILAEQDILSTVDRLAAAAQSVSGPTQEVRARLVLKAAAMGSREARVTADARKEMQRVLNDAKYARIHADAILSDGAALTEALSLDRDRMRVAMRGLLKAGQLSLPDQAGLIVERTKLERIGLPKDDHAPRLPAPFLKELRTEVQRLALSPMDGYERQAVIPSLGYALGLAGLWAESDQLLRDGLKKSHSDYYLMSQLGSNARKQGKSQEAIQWYQRAYENSVGPATRLQWGVGYLAALTELAPEESKRIESLAVALIQEASQDPAAFQERSGRSMQRLGRLLSEWNRMASQASALGAVRDKLESVCKRLPDDDGQRVMCLAVADRLK